MLVPRSELLAVPAEETNVSYRRRKTCRICGENTLRKFLSLGPMALANSFLRSENEFLDESIFPLDVHFCESCYLVQLLDIVDPEVLFRYYLYVTGTSETIAAHNRQYSKTIVELLGLSESDLVVEVASNDGSLLKCFRDFGVRTLGVDPAENVAALARAQGIETIAEFFDPDIARRIVESHGTANAVIGNNVLAHVDDPVGFLTAFRELLAPRGLAVLEMPYLGNLLRGIEYDTIYHEHLSYFSVSSLMKLCDRADLSIVRIDDLPIHGGSLRLYAGSREHYLSHDQAVVARAHSERDAGLTSFERYKEFANRVRESRRTLLGLIDNLRGNGKSIVGYGASAKGTVLLNYCGIGTRLIPYTVDKSPLKVGLFTPGTHIPVLPVEKLLESQPDYVLVLAWNFADEIIRQQREYQRRGGKFIVPIPELRVV